MSSGKPKDGDLQIVPVTKAADHPRPPAVPPLPLKVSAAAAGSSALVEYKAPVFKEEEEDLELKLRRILENVPVRVSNTSGSSAGAGSGDFHQYRQMRRKEQDRLTRMDVDYQRRKEVAEFNMRREERLKAAEERTAKKRSKRQKKKQKKKEQKTITTTTEEGAAPSPGEERQKQESSDDDEDDGTDCENESEVLKLEISKK
ncbi:PRKR-interacting protein 1 [Linum perenne]